MKRKLQKLHKKAGFTLVEVMVSVAIFSTIMTIGIGALVTVTNAYNVSQERKIVNDNLNFLMEGLTRELRVGTGYYRGATDDSNAAFVRNGSSNSIGFHTVENRGYYVYMLDGGVVYRRRFVGASAYSERLTDPSQIRVTDLEFNIVGANETGVDTNQVYVWIFVTGEAPDSKHESTVSIQTMVSQRGLDLS